MGGLSISKDKKILSRCGYLDQVLQNVEEGVLYLSILSLIPPAMKQCLV